MAGTISARNDNAALKDLAHGDFPSKKKSNAGDRHSEFASTNVQDLELEVGEGEGFQDFQQEEFSDLGSQGSSMLKKRNDVHETWAIEDNEMQMGKMMFIRLGTHTLVLFLFSIV